MPAFLYRVCGDAKAVRKLFGRDVDTAEETGHGKFPWGFVQRFEFRLGAQSRRKEDVRSRRTGGGNS